MSSKYWPINRLKCLLFYYFIGTNTFGLFVLFSNGAVVKTINKFDKQTPVDSTVELTCQLTDYYGAEVQWRKLEGRMSDESEERNGRLIIHGVTREDDGDYECYLSSGQSSKAKLTVYGSNNKAKIFQKELGGTVELVCDFNNEQNLKWLKVNGEMSKYRREYGAPNNRLLLYYLSEQDSGDYECYLPNGESRRVTLNVIKNVDYKMNAEQGGGGEDDAELNEHGQNEHLFYTEPQARNYDSEFENSDHNSNDNKNEPLKHSDSFLTIEREAEQNVELACDLELDDYSQLKWRKLSGELSEYARKNHNKLEIDYLEEADTGVYECSTVDNSRRASIRLIVNARQDELANQAPQNNQNDNGSEAASIPQADNGAEIVKQLGDDVEIRCGITEEYNDINWSKKNGDLGKNVLIYQNLLYIRNLKQENSGYYECFTDQGQTSLFHLTLKKPYEEEETTTTFSPNDIEAYLENKDLLISENHHGESKCTAKTHASSLSIEWYAPNGEVIREDDDRLAINTYTMNYEPLQKESILKINYANLAKDSGTFECRVTVNDHIKSLFFDVKVEPYTYEPDVVEQDSEARALHDAPFSDHHQNINYHRTCDVHEATCKNGQCILRAGLCDGIRNCDDGSDEENCEISHGQCQPNEKACNNGKCIQKIWLCDGEKDCSEGEDEIYCCDMCQSFEFMCRNRRQCISKSFQCDSEIDCNDGSDEIGCESPRITLNPVRNIKVTIDATFTIECRAEGFPAPYINWRLNWGHVCKEPRCYATNDKGHGILTVTHAQLNDSGAYSCEAINTVGRKFAVDTIVEIEAHRYLEATTRAISTTTSPRIEVSDCLQMCHNHSNYCTCSACYNCEHNTMGKNCELCKPGYTGDATRGTPYDCVPIGYTTRYTTTPEPYYPPPVIEEEANSCAELCHNHSDNCTCSYCFDCKHNTEGNLCERCRPGYYGDATKGTELDCLPIGQTTTEPPPSDCLSMCNNHTNECTCSKCLNCQDNTYGDKCQYCLAGYEGDATRGTPYDCRPINQNECHPYGTLKKFSSQCKCKTLVEGRFCDRCKAFAFNLNENSKLGCQSCFCNGLNANCRQSDLYYEKIYANFEEESDSWLLSDRFLFKSLNLEPKESGVEFQRFSEFDSDDLFFLAPTKFKYNKLNSYGGNLTFKLLYKAYSTHELTQPFEIRLSGNRVNIYHKHPILPVPDAVNEVTIRLHEDEFKRYGDNGKVGRDHMMMVLADIETIMIRAKFSHTQHFVSLNEFNLDYAEDRPLSASSQRAINVEVCDCPSGYAGHSCEHCASGYKRVHSGFFLGLCEPL